MREYKPFPSELRGDVAAVAEHGWTVEPFVEGAPEDYRRLRELLAWANYTEAGFRARFEIDSLAEYKQRRAREAELPITTPLELLARLFLDGDPVEREAARALLGDDGVAALERLALLHAPAAEPHTVRATLLLYPTFGLWIASDAGSDPNGEDLPPPRDVVYPAITLGTQRFVQLMPHEPCGDFVELCSGTGIAALVAARDFATHAWAVDLTERSTRFARFNAALNAIENFTALEGDLYEPLGDRTFDRIVAHPPYVPSFETQYVFRDGGEDGEQITRGIVSRLDRYLRPGGTCFISCMVSDRVGAPAERRMRETLGAVAGEFDVVVAQEHLFDPAAYYARQAQYGEVDWGAVGRRLEAFKQLGIEKLVLCGMQFRRRALEDRSTPVLTERRMLGPRTSPADFAWLLDHGARARAQALEAAPERFRPRVANGVIVRTEHECVGREWSSSRCEIVLDVPFIRQMQCPWWFEALLLRCDGETDARALRAGLIRDGLVPPDADETGLPPMLLRLVEQGVLEVPEWPLPPRATSEEG